jgi:hypothetical protein
MNYHVAIRIDERLSYAHLWRPLGALKEQEKQGGQVESILQGPCPPRSSNSSM